MSAGIPLIAFDQSAISAGRGAAAAIRDSLDLAVRCETLGYSRFWVAEHHLNDAIAGSACEILATAIAVRTRRIRVGAAGVLLPLYEPFKVAEQFRTLSALAPGRIDLGIARAPRLDPRIFSDIHTRADIDRTSYRDRIERLLGWLDDKRPDIDAATASPQAMPADAVMPQPWVMVSSIDSAEIAASFALPICLNLSSEQNAFEPEAVFDAYRRRFTARADRQRPHTAVMA